MDETVKKSPKNTIKKSISKFTMANTPVLEYGKLPPQALELEEAVLGALMLEQNALNAVIDLLTPEMFYKESHQKIFFAIRNLSARSEPVDILTVTNELKKNGALEIVGGPYFITQLTNRVASSANIEFHVRIIIQKYIQRELIRIASEITKEAYEDSTDVFDLLDKAEQNLFAISEKNFKSISMDMKSLLKDAIDQIELISKQEQGLSGVPSGFSELDRVTSGWQKSDLIIIASRPGMGKTALAISMARKITVIYKKPVAIFSLEMSSLQLVTRLISGETEISSGKLRRGNLEQYEWQQLNSRIKNIAEAPLYIDDTAALSIFELRAKCRRMKAKYNVELIIVDYLQLMSTGNENKGNREQEISNISRSLKALSKELNIPIIVLSQLSRAVETRTGSKRPILSDLRESGAIEQDADLVLFIYRPEYYKINVDEEGNSTEGSSEIIIAKHRNGALKTINLQFVDKFAKFVEPDITSLDADNLKTTNDTEKGTTTYTIQSKLNDMDDDKPF